MDKNKILISIFITVILQWVGSINSYQIPRLFEPQIIQKFNISTVEYSYLYTSVTFPGLITCLISVKIINKIGSGISCVIFTSIIFFGTLLIYIGFSFNSFFLILIGRFVYGLAVEPIFVAQSTIAEKWFKGRLLSVVYGTSQAMNNIVSAIGTYLMPLVLIKSRSFDLPMFIFCLVNAFSFFAGAILAILDFIYEGRMNISDEDNSNLNRKLKEFRFKDAFKLKKISYISVLALIFTSQALLQLTFFTLDLMENRYGLSYLDSKNIAVIVTITLGILVAPFSLVTTKYGKKSIILLISNIVLLGNFIFASRLDKNCNKIYLQIFGFLHGFAFSLYLSTSWPSIVLTVPQNAVSFIVALATTGKMVFMVILPPIFGEICKNRDVKSYQNSLYLLMLIAVFGFCFSFYLVILDYREGRLLDLPENDDIVQNKIKKMTSDFEGKNEEATLTLLTNNNNK